MATRRYNETHKLLAKNETTHETPKQDARRDDATATTDTPQLVQTGVEQAGAATSLLAITAIAAHTITRRKRRA